MSNPVPAEKKTPLEKVKWSGFEPDYGHRHAACKLFPSVQVHYRPCTHEVSSFQRKVGVCVCAMCARLQEVYASAMKSKPTEMTCNFHCQVKLIFRVSKLKGMQPVLCLI